MTLMGTRSLLANRERLIVSELFSYAGGAETRSLLAGAPLVAQDVEAELLRAQRGGGRVAGLRIARRLQDRLQPRDLVEQRYLLRHAVGILEKRVRHPDVLRHCEVGLEIDGLARRDVIELAILDGLADPVFSQGIEGHRNDS